MSIYTDPKDRPKSAYDVCIVGSGPAGLTLASELAETGLKICVLESGSLKKTPHADALRAVKSTGDILIKPSSRERVLGGTSTTWAGLSAPLDPIDFEHWPIKLSDLLPYYEKAYRYGFPHLGDFSVGKMAGAKKSADLVPVFTHLEEKIFIANDPPWNFGKRLRYLFENIHMDLFIDATVTGFVSEMEQSKIKISGVTVRSSSGTHETILAKIVVLAAGGIENTRLLLASKIGKENDQVGRYLTNHPKGSVGIIKLASKIHRAPHLFGFLENGQSQYAGFRFPDAVQKNRGLLNSYLRFEPMYPWTDNRGVEALIALTKQTKGFLDWWKRRQKGIVHLRDWNETGDDKAHHKTPGLFTLIWKIITHPRGVILYSFYRLSRKKDPAIRAIRIRNFMDMEPRRENKMILSQQFDAYGQLIPEIHIALSERDRTSLIELHKTLGQEVEKLGIGKLESDLGRYKTWPCVFDASHHLGGTIMGNDPKTSVVDKNLKVHGTANLYVVGGSVFPSAGCANPTYTICALSIRLAEEIASKCKKQEKGDK